MPFRVGIVDLLENVEINQTLDFALSLIFHAARERIRLAWRAQAGGRARLKLLNLPATTQVKQEAFSSQEFKRPTSGMTMVPVSTIPRTGLTTGSSEPNIPPPGVQGTGQGGSPSFAEMDTGTTPVLRGLAREQHQRLRVQIPAVRTSMRSCACTRPTRTAGRCGWRPNALCRSNCRMPRTSRLSKPVPHSCRLRPPASCSLLQRTTVTLWSPRQATQSTEQVASRQPLGQGQDSRSTGGTRGSRGHDSRSNWRVGTTPTSPTSPMLRVCSSDCSR
jgi:hypothetical protein